MSCRKTDLNSLFLLISFVLAFPLISVADEKEEKEEKVRTGEAGLGIDPSVVKQASTTGSGDAPPPLTIRTSKQEWQFGYHGYLRAPMRFSFDKEWVKDGDLNSIGKKWIFSAPPRLPDMVYTDWTYTNNVNGPWAEMLFSYGNSVAVASVSFSSWNITDGSYRNVQAQLGIDQAWVTLNFPTAFERAGGLKIEAGVFGNRYGQAGRWDAGRYDTYIFGRTHQTGFTTTAFFDVSDKVILQLEHGFGAKLDILPKWEWFDALDGTTSPWMPYNGETESGTSMVNHVHAGVFLNNFKTFEQAIIAAHFMHAFTADADEQAGEHDAKLMTMGGEFKVNGGWFGDLYLGYAHLISANVNRLDIALETLHSQGGYFLIQNYYGPQGTFAGNGKIDTFEFQYMLSVSRLIWNLQGKNFWGQGPDLQISFWGMVNFIHSKEHIITDQTIADFAFPEKKFKWGTEALYIPISWLGFSLRYDQIHPDWEDHIRRESTPVQAGGDGDRNFRNKTFHILSPKLRFKTAFVTHEEIILSYHRYFYEGYNGRDIHAVYPYTAHDTVHRNAFMLHCTMWW